MNKPIPLFAYGEFENVRLTPAHLAKLQQRWGEKLTTQRIQHFSRQKEAHGYKYKSDYAAILAWYPEDRTECIDDDPTPEMAKEIEIAKRRTRQEMQRQWDLDAAKHQHSERCQFGRVCRYVPAKRPVI